MEDDEELEVLFSDVVRAAGALKVVKEAGETYLAIGTLLSKVRAVYDRGVADGMERMLHPGTPEEQAEAAKRGRKMLQTAKFEAAQTRVLLRRVHKALIDGGHASLASHLTERFQID